MARTKQTVRLSTAAAAAQRKAAESGAEVCLRYNPAVDLVAVSGEDAQEEVMELHLAEERHVAIRGLVAGGNLAALGGKVVGLVLVVPSMVYTLLINTLQVISSIWGKWPHQNPPEVSYVRLRAGRAACTHSLLPTTRKPIRRGMCVWADGRVGGGLRDHHARTGLSRRHPASRASQPPAALASSS